MPRAPHPRAKQFRAVLATAFVAAVMALPCAASDLGPATRALNEGRINDTLSLARAAIAANPADAAAHLLACRAYYAEEVSDPAVAECEAAIANGGSRDSHTQDWMGRAYGLKASRAGAFSGFSLARKVRAAFEAAVNLDPHNAAAVNDLSEFYIAAPGIVGGGTDKAAALATRVASSLPQSAHRIRALLAAKSGDANSADREYRAAAAVFNAPGAWVDLGIFLSGQKRLDEAAAALHRAAELDTAKGPALLDVASVLNTMHRDPALAEKALHDYLVSPARTDASPAFKAHVELANLALRAGNKPKARTEFQAALALAADFAPAQKGLRSL